MLASKNAQVLVNCILPMYLYERNDGCMNVNIDI